MTRPTPHRGFAQMSADKCKGTSTETWPGDAARISPHRPAVALGYMSQKLWAIQDTTDHEEQRMIWFTAIWIAWNSRGLGLQK